MKDIFADDDVDDSDSNELSDVAIDDEEAEKQLNEALVEELGEDENDEEQEEEDEEEQEDEEEEIEDPDDAEDFDENDAERYDLQDMESDESDEYSAPVAAPVRSSRPSREIKKRQLTFYEEDELLDSEEEVAAPKKKQVKLTIPKRSSARAALRAPKKEVDEFADFELEYKPKKLTERQRAKLEEDPNERYEDLMFARMDQQLLALNRKIVKREETAEQAALRRAENARKRQHYKVKQLEEAKRDTLNKLLKRRATKTREKEAEDEDADSLTLKPRRPVVNHPAMLRWVSRAEGIVLAASEPAFFET
ncbi:hypothetical protein PUMCH_002483 [Australozyma saopauloensis]|uniref:INO80 complex subunit B-like conserved region domain-containing protein n=1 Tax=Australozyma saopauloensis TaxID=291208 RepID=A0AAX4HA40_9ASCO|nr:hypothetical protein PUMCH_002483 [[Candida] saopauloensis]